MEKCYLFLNLGIYQAIEHIVAQEKPKTGKYYFDLACAPDENKNQLFNVELISLSLYRNSIEISSSPFILRDSGRGIQKA